MVVKMKEVYNPFIAKYEEPLLFFIVKRTYKYLHPDIATSLAILSSAACFVLYLDANQNPFNYLLACFCIFAHCIFDGIDGKIAKARDMNRKNGYVIDKISDGICSVFFISGFFFAVTRNVTAVAVFLFLFGLIYASYRYCYFKKNYDVKVLGTESRIVLTILNIVYFFSIILSLTSSGTNTFTATGKNFMNLSELCSCIMGTKMMLL